MKNKLVVLLVVIITLIGFFLRFWGLTDNPISLNIDEVSYGYSAYSILKTGRDETGIFMPISFSSTGDYKSPILIYSLVPSIVLFGLNEFAIRFTTALAGALSIPIFFLLIEALLKNKKVAFIGAALLTISPWHIFYSRFASESLMATFFLILGMWFFLKLTETGKKTFAILASLTLILSIYTYHSHKIFIPLFIFVVFLLYRKRMRIIKKSVVLFLITGLILLLPILSLSIFGPAGTRAKMVFLSQDIDYTRYVILDHLERFGENFLLFFFWIKRYLNYFQPDFLFFNGLNMTTAGTLGLGVLYLFELPWLVLGAIEIIRRKIENKGIIIWWILLSLLPASLTNNEQSSVRSLLVLPMLLVIVSLGVVKFFQLVNKLHRNVIKLGLTGAYFCFTGVILIQTFLIFSVHFPLQRGEAFMEGTKETILYALQHKDIYQEIVYDPYRGIEAPYIVNIPYMYILFYSKYDPVKYQKEIKRFGNDTFGFDKFTIRKIDWRVDRGKKGTLFIGSPWSLPLNDLKNAQILQKIYLSNGQLALLIVTPN